MSNNANSSGRHTEPTNRDDGLEVDPTPFEHEQDTQKTHVNEDDELMIPVAEEELTATKHDVDRGAVRLHRDVVAEEQTLNVPVTEEEVDVTRRHVDRPASASDVDWEDESIEIPVRGEEVDAQKQTRVREEIDIDKEPVTREQQVSGAVRREEVELGGDNVTEASPRRRA